MFALHDSDRQTTVGGSGLGGGFKHTYREQDAGAPHKGEEVEGAELARLVELAVFGLGEVLLSVDFLQI